MKEFNVTGTCIPEKHYMADISEKIGAITAMIEKEQYFTINRARQYGKTTTLAALYRRLKNDYVVIRLSFEGLGEESFCDNTSFVRQFIEMVSDFWDFLGESKELLKDWCDMSFLFETFQQDPFDVLGKKISTLCKKSERDIIVMIDEVDKSSDNQVFLNFLGMLRNKYLRRSEGMDDTFKSVILAGVYDIKNLKVKLRPDMKKKYNSPWNVAADFKVDMSLSTKEIISMLQEYEEDYHTGMDVEDMSRQIYSCTSGYPFLVSWLCKWMDEEGGKVWTPDNLQEAEKELLKRKNTLFDDLIKNMENDADLKQLVTRILYDGMELSFNIANPVIERGVILGIFAEKNHLAAISNILMETYLYDYIISLKSVKEKFSGSDRNQFVKAGKLNMALVLTRFQELLWTEYRTEDEKFIEQQGRLLFLCFLKPIINGTGFYYVEPETRNSTRMDLVVTYGKEEYIIELKIWRGEKYRMKGLKQLEKYLDYRGRECGYLLSFSFNKGKENRSGWIEDEAVNKKIFEVVV